MKIYFIAVKADRVLQLCDRLIKQSCWFGVEPWPEDQWCIMVKPENNVMFDAITAEMDIIQKGYSTL